MRNLSYIFLDCLRKWVKDLDQESFDAAFGILTSELDRREMLLAEEELIFAEYNKLYHPKNEAVLES